MRATAAAEDMNLHSADRAAGGTAGVSRVPDGSSPSLLRGVTGGQRAVADAAEELREKKMWAKTILASIFAISMLYGGPAIAGGTVIDNPDAVVKEITTLIADGRVPEVSVAISKYIEANPDDSRNELFHQNMVTALTIFTRAGKANGVDEIYRADFGTSIKVIVEYINFPLSDNVTNQYAFFKYTFMKIPNGWRLTEFTYSSSGQFPPPGWVLSH